MADLTKIFAKDPTLEAADSALEEREAKSGERRQYLGMSQAGDECDRFLMYSFRWAFTERYGADTLKRFLDGHASEDVQAERLRLVPGITLETHTEDGNQFRYVDHDGHFSGHCDGKITGLLQAPKKKHIWEAKAVGEKKLAEFRKIKIQLGEKKTLQKWNFTYYVQAQLYMHYEGTDRHYLTVSSPGVRDWDSCRTEYDPAFAMKQRARAARLIKMEELPTRISEKPDYWKCKYCPALGICHGGEMPERTCRTCVHSTPVAEGQWLCERFGKILTPAEQQAGCPAHKYMPAFVPGEVIDATERSIKYLMKDGSTWEDAEDGSEQ